MPERAFILVVEADPTLGESIEEALKRAGHACHWVIGADEALDSLRQRPPHVLVTDYKVNGKLNGLELVKQARRLNPWTEGILLTARVDDMLVRDAFKEAAVFDYLKKPVDLEQMRQTVSEAAHRAMSQRENLDPAMRLQKEANFQGIVAASGAMVQVLDRVRRIAKTKLTALIYGESGTGKELVAQAIHNNSDRRNKAWVPVNCAGISETLVESELFGHVRGAFTNAHVDRRGLFEEADGGTIFLDEIGDMPLSIQAKLLRVLENGEVVRVGANLPSRVDVRVVAATNRDLRQAVREKQFREDLFFRINQAEINLLPLRDRREDIPPLVLHFIQKANARHGKSIRSVAPEAQRQLLNYRWPGNIRELENALNQMVALCEGDTLQLRDLPPQIQATTDIVPTGPRMLNVPLKEIERQAIQLALTQNAGNREKAAKQLGIGARTLYRKLKEYGLS